jgi:hypothetical protein
MEKDIEKLWEAKLPHNFTTPFPTTAVNSF